MWSDRPAAQLANVLFDLEIDFLQQDTNDDGESFIVGVAPAQYLARLQTGGRHGPVDRLAAAVHQHRPQADGRHKVDSLKSSLQRVRLFHRAAAKLYDRQLALKLADIAEGLDQRVGFAYSVVHSGPRESVK